MHCLWLVVHVASYMVCVTWICSSCCSTLLTRINPAINLYEKMLFGFVWTPDFCDCMCNGIHVFTHPFLRIVSKLACSYQTCETHASVDMWFGKICEHMQVSRDDFKPVIRQLVIIMVVSPFHPIILISLQFRAE